jgi:putative flippase GtrA
VRTAKPAPAAVPVHIVIPVHNEEADLVGCVRALHAYLRSSFPYSCRITIADNASTDDTLALAQAVAGELAGVDVVHLARKGRGYALREVWSASPSPVLVYMDVDLSTDLAALLPLVAPLVSGHSDVAIGTRLGRGARIVRGLKREVISRGYNALLHATLLTRFSDAQCGFKAIRREAARRLLPHVRDGGWFFDTELLVLAQRTGLRIHEVPVDWVDDPDSRVDLIVTARADLRGIARLWRTFLTGAVPLRQLRAESASSRAAQPTESASSRAAHHAAGRADSGQDLARQLARFAAIGVVSTVAFLALFAVLRPGLGAQPANVVALLACALANTAANRRVTFGVTTRRDLARHHVQGLFVFSIGLALTSGSLAAVDAALASPPRSVELAALVVANLAATVVRFALMRLWVFRSRGISARS